MNWTFGEFKSAIDNQVNKLLRKDNLRVEKIDFNRVIGSAVKEIVLNKLVLGGKINIKKIGGKDYIVKK